MMKNLLVLVFALALSAANEINLKGFISRNRHFSSTLYKELSEKEGNFLVSPFSAETALAVAQSGAKNETGKELRSALLLQKEQDVDAVFRHLVRKLKSRKSYSLFTANKMFVQKKFNIKDEFVKRAKEVYQCSVEKVDFANKSQAAKSINSWVEKKTKNKIKDLVSDSTLDERTVAVLISALYFKGQWNKLFKGHLTAKGDFFKAPEETVQAEMMHNTDYYDYSESEELDAKFLRMAFKGSKKVEMVVVLPNKKDGLGALEDRVFKAFAVPSFKRLNVNVSLPKFRIDTSIDLKSILKVWGVKRAFGPDADFSRIAPKKDGLYISNVLQKTFINVNEFGVEAAAATSVQFQGRSFMQHPEPKVNFIADHPFLFYIRMKNVIIFTGRIVHPSV